MNEPDDRTILHVKRRSEPPEPTRASAEPIHGIEDVEGLAAEFRRPAPERLDVEGVLASGGMGAVHVVVDRAIGRRMAMKTMHAMLRDDTRMLRMFLREARTNGQLDHPNIVPVYDVGQREDGGLYFTMKLVEGRTLKDLIKALPEGAIDPHVLFNLLDVVVKVCDALAFAHSRGVVHCDIKPANVMVGDFGEVYLMDWGIARLQGSGADRASMPDAGEAAQAPAPGESGHTGDAVLGTAAYMSPEQAEGSRFMLDARSDVFSVGALLYEILVRRPPYRAESHEETLALARTAGYVRPSEAAGEARVPPEVERIVLKAMARHRSDRYADTDALKADLLRYMRGGAEFPQTSFPRGAVMVREGDPGNSAYIIVSGRAEVRKKMGGVDQVLKTLGAGEVFGEMAVLTESPRTATVVAVEDTTVLVVTSAVLGQELDLLKPWMARLMHTLAERFRDLYTTKRVTLSGGPSAPRLANQLLMHLQVWGNKGEDGTTRGRWSEMAREVEAQMGAAPHTVHMVVARYPGIELDLEHDELILRDAGAFAERVRADLGA